MLYWFSSRREKRSPGRFNSLCLFSLLSSISFTSVPQQIKAHPCISNSSKIISSLLHERSQHQKLSLNGYWVLFKPFSWPKYQLSVKHWLFKTQAPHVSPLLLNCPSNAFLFNARKIMKLYKFKNKVTQPRKGFFLYTSSASRIMGCACEMVCIVYAFKRIYMIDLMLCLKLD